MYYLLFTIYYLLFTIYQVKSLLNLINQLNELTSGLQDNPPEHRTRNSSNSLTYNSLFTSTFFYSRFGNRETQPAHRTAKREETIRQKNKELRQKIAEHGTRNSSNPSNSSNSSNSFTYYFLFTSTFFYSRFGNRETQPAHRTAKSK